MRRAILWVLALPAARSAAPRRLRRAAVADVYVRAPRVRVHAISDLHTDHKANLEWCQALQRPAGEAHHVLIVAGDISCDVETLAETLKALKKRYDDVFYVAGNHEAWVGKDDVCITSLDKLAKVAQTALDCGCRVEAARIVDASDRAVTVVPLQSWYHSSHDVEADDPTRDRELRRFERLWADFRRCRWPAHLVGDAHEAQAPQSNSDEGDSPRVAATHGEDDAPSTAPHGMRSGDGLARHFAAMNDDLFEDDVDEVDDEYFGHVLTFSHFSPRLECVPERRFLLHAALPKVAGSDALGRQVASIKPAVHVFGHTHIPIDVDLDGTVFLQWPLGSPREQLRQCRSCAEAGPLEVLDSDFGLVRLKERTAWGKYYTHHPRQPDCVDLAPWVQDYQRRGKPEKRVQTAKVET
ncbi:hypothetical protein M885DRAFT_526990 [Pelagophyceae sp. CCMP2097]|nr:hypothetical protein M885DRAFT_526990 [Pelagophyceae sp. CCMP2097]|mmetsp:Transcript_5611/g.19945  ORF Transcript_5611/g.19945 Transcript_5611/m.19945 type:complete len:411 (+) Transcript_5611:129-1361(+)